MSTDHRSRRAGGPADHRRRDLLKASGLLLTLLATPAFALDLFKIIDPANKSKDLQKTKDIFKGAGSILASTQELDYHSEFAIGESLALEGFQRYGLPIEDAEFQRYINLVGDAVARHSDRPKIPYYFVVVSSPLYNAFACPGGIIFVSEALVKAMQDESELACVLSHEVSHVTHKHALKTIRRAKFFEGLGTITAATLKGRDGQKFKNIIGGLQSVLFEKGLDKNMEYEADLSAMEIAYRTGYDPNGMIKVLEMLQTREKTAQKSGSWFSTHPPLASRIEKCRARRRQYPDAASLARVKQRFISYRKRI